MRTAQLLTLLLPAIQAVKVTVNSNHPVKYIDEDSSDSEIILRCGFEVSEGIKVKFEEACQRFRSRNSNGGACAYVKWLAKGLPGASRDQFVTIARPAPQNYVLPSFQARYEIADPYSLRLKGPIKHDYLNGTYQCRVEVDIDAANNEDTANFDLFVRVPPKNVRLEAEEQPQLDQPVNFTCISDGHPEASYDWFFDGEKVDPRKDIPVLSASGKIDDDSITDQFSTFEDGKILHIKKVMVGHQGVYQCNARNDALKGGLRSQEVTVEPTYMNMSMVFWVGSGVAVIAACAILVILCCCCCGGEEEVTPRHPGAILHGRQVDPKTGREMNFSSGRHAVTPAKSQLTQSTFGSGGNTDDVYQQNASNSYYSQQQDLPPKFDLEATLRSQNDISMSQQNTMQNTMQNTPLSNPPQNAYEINNTPMNYARQSQQQMYNNYNEQQNALVQNSTHYDNY